MQRRAGRLTPSLSALPVAKMGSAVRVRHGAQRRRPEMGRRRHRRRDDDHDPRDFRPARRASACLLHPGLRSRRAIPRGRSRRGAVRARRQRQHRGAQRRRQDGRNPRPADRDRQPRRRRRHRRDPLGREEPARRLHPPGGDQRDGWDLAEPHPKPRLRSAQGLCPDRPDRRDPQPDRGASELPRPLARRTDQDRQGGRRRPSRTGRPAPARSTISRSSSSPTGPA